MVQKTASTHLVCTPFSKPSHISLSRPICNPTRSSILYQATSAAVTQSVDNSRESCVSNRTLVPFRSQSSPEESMRLIFQLGANVVVSSDAQVTSNTFNVSKTQPVLCGQSKTHIGLHTGAQIDIQKISHPVQISPPTTQFPQQQARVTPKVVQVMPKPSCIVAVQTPKLLTPQDHDQKDGVNSRRDGEQSTEIDGRTGKTVPVNSSTAPYRVQRRETRMEIVKYILQDHNYGAPPPSPQLQAALIQHSKHSTAYALHSGAGSSFLAGSSSSSIGPSYSQGFLLNVRKLKDVVHDDDDDETNSAISSGSEREIDPQGEETETAPEDEGNDEDSITRCVCNFQHDDGYMICCDRCFVWQHVDCMGIDRTNIPEEYLCEKCQPRRVDRHRARALQLRKREELLNSSTSGDSSTETSSDGDGAGEDDNENKNENGDDNARGSGSGGGGGGSSENANSKDDAVPNVTARRKQPLASHRKTRSLSGSRYKGQVSSNESPVTVAVTRQRPRRDSTKEHPQPVSSGMQRRSSTAQNKRKEVKEVKEVPAKLAVSPENRRVSMRRRVIKSKSLDSDSDTPEVETMQQLRQWISHYEEAVTNHYSPELRARIASIRVNGVHSDLRPGSLNTGAVRCRVQQLSPSVRILVSTVQLSTNQPVIELRGKYMLSSQHKSPQSIAGHMKRPRPPPGPFIFFYRLPREGSEVCVDTRTYGNDGRFVRRSCRPNAEIRHCIEKGTLHLYIVTTANIEKNTEITISHDTPQDSEGNPISCACGNAAECLALNPKKPVQEVSDREQRRRSRRTTSSEEGESSPANQQIQPNTSALAPRRSVISIKLPPQKIEEPQPEKLSPSSSSEATQEPEKKRKLTREERKMEAIMKAFERLEKAEQRRQENQAKQAQKKDHDTVKKESRIVKERVKLKEKDSAKEKTELPQNVNKQGAEKPRRRRRKGQRRRSSSSQQQAATQQKHHTRLNSVSSNASSVDEMIENTEPSEVEQSAEARESNVPDSTQAGGLSSAADLLLAFASAGSPQHTDETGEQENVTQHQGTQLVPSTPQNQISSHPPMFGTVCDSGGSISSQGSTPPTNLSSACLLVAAAVGPLAPGFKFPKTKKVLMNEWLSKSPDPPAVPPLPSPPVPSDCPRSSAGLEPGINRLVQGPASAKKRWLRQAISEECDSPSPNSRPESPPCQDYVTPLKKRRLARTSVSSERSFTPPTTPTMLAEHHAAGATKVVSQYDAHSDNFRGSCDEEDTNVSLEDTQSVHEEEEEEEEDEEEDDQYGTSRCEARESELRPVQESAVELTYGVNIEKNQSHVIKTAHPSVIRHQHNFGSYSQYADTEFPALDKSFRNTQPKMNYVSQQDSDVNCGSVPKERISGEGSEFRYKGSRNEDYDGTGGCGSGAGGSAEDDNEEEEEQDDDDEIDIEEDEEAEEAGDDIDDDDNGHDDHDAARGEDADDNGDDEGGDFGDYEAVSGEGQAGGRRGNSGTGVMDEEGEHEGNGMRNKKKGEEEDDDDEMSDRDEIDVVECSPVKRKSSTSPFCNETRKGGGILQTSHNYKVTSAECSVISSCKSAERDKDHTRIRSPRQSVQKNLEEEHTKQEERINTVLVQPAKRKLSISEYRQRKQHTGSGSEQGVIKKENTCCSPSVIRSRSSSTSSTSSLSPDDDDDQPQRNNIENSPETSALPLIVNTECGDEKRGITEDVNYMRWNCAPTLVERERENLTERLRREFGLFLGEEEEQERARRQGLIQESNSDLKRKLLLPPPPPQIISHSDSAAPPSTLLSPPVVSAYSAAHKICAYSSDSGNYSSGLYTPALHAPVVSGPAYSPLYSMKGPLYQPFTAGLHPKSSVATSPVKGKLGVLPAATFVESSEAASVAHTISESQYLVRGAYSEPVIPLTSSKETTSHYVGHVAVTHTTSTVNPQPFYSTASKSYLKPSSHN